MTDYSIEEMTVELDDTVTLPTGAIVLYAEPISDISTNEPVAKIMIKYLAPV